MKKIVFAAITTLALVTAVSAAEVNGKACAACHGLDWTKVHMGNKNVAEMTHADIATALKGYKDGSYGGAKKALMKGQVGRYSDAELDAFALTIGK